MIIVIIWSAHLREEEMWVEEQVVGDRGVVGNTEEGHEPGNNNDADGSGFHDDDDDDRGITEDNEDIDICAKRSCPWDKLFLRL